MRLGDPHGAVEDGPGGTVERVDVVGEDAYAYLRVDRHPVVARVPAAQRPAPGATVRVAVRWADAHLFDAATGERVVRR